MAKDRGWDYLNSEPGEFDFDANNDGSYGNEFSDGSSSYYGADGSWGYTNSDGYSSYYEGDENESSGDDSNGDSVDTSTDNSFLNDRTTEGSPFVDSLVNAAAIGTLIFGAVKLVQWLSGSDQPQRDEPVEPPEPHVPTKEEIKKDRRDSIIAICVLLGILVGIQIWLFLLTRERVPFSSAEARGMNLNDVMLALEEAGFENIKTVVDSSGWLNDNQVTSISIDGETKFRKGKFAKTEATIVVKYSSPGRVYVTDTLENWENCSPAIIDVKLKKLGLTNYAIKEIPTSEPQDNQAIEGIYISGKAFNDEKCYIPTDALVIVQYWVYKIAIGNSSGDFKGESIQKVTAELRNRGFTNIRVEEYKQGWAEGNTVIEVRLDGECSFESDYMLSPDALIQIKYSSNDRIDVTDIVSKWHTAKDANSMKEILEMAGLKNTIVREKCGEDLSVEEYSLTGLNINYEPYYEGRCYIQVNAPIAVEYYRVKITIGNRLGKYMDDKKMMYRTVVDSLIKMGFTNIHLYRNNALITGWLDSEGSIASFTIDGKKSFSETDSFYRDVPIEIVVNTFKKNSSCKEISDVKKK